MCFGGVSFAQNDVWIFGFISPADNLTQMVSLDAADIPHVTIKFKLVSTGVRPVCHVRDFVFLNANVRLP